MLLQGNNPNNQTSKKKKNFEGGFGTESESWEDDSDSEDSEDAWSLTNRGPSW